MYVERSIEVLWLLTAIAIPLLFLPKTAVLSEAVNAYVEVPKTVALRTLVGMMAILWIAEWLLKGGLTKQYNITNYTSRLRNWLREQPTRWVVIAACAYIMVAIISTALSQAFWISVWGEVSGQFGYSLYTLASYFVLFIIITTHLKTRDQLWRLLGVIVVMGALAAVYGIIQHYDVDPLDQGEAGSFRVASTMANSVFAGALLVGTTILTFGLGSMAMDRWGWSPARVIVWIALMAGQLMAVYWTGARGSWLIGVPVGLMVFLALPAFATAIGSYMKERTVPLDLLALLAVLVVLGVIVVLHQINFLDVLDVGGVPLLRILQGLVLLLGFVSVIILVYRTRFSTGVRTFAKSFLPLASALVIVFLIIELQSFEIGGGGAGDVATTAVGQGEGSIAASPDPNVARGLSYRTDIWSASLGLVINRPWFEYENLSLSFIRPLVGYGPELFKYTFPLESPLGGLLSQAHNFYLHHAVEQGILGFITSISLILSLVIVGLVQLLRNRDTYSTTHKWLIIILLATIIGRSAEMMVGVARESDLVLFWMLLAIFVVLPSVMKESKEEAVSVPVVPPLPQPTSRQQRRGGSSGRRERRSASRATESPTGQLGMLQGGVLGLVAALVIFIGWLTWDKNIDYAWAAGIAATARDEFGTGNLQEAQRLMGQAVSKAPDVPIYYHNLAGIYDAYRNFADQNPDRELPSCEEYFSLETKEASDFTETNPYARCAEEAYLSNFGGYLKNRTSPQAKLVLANSTLTLAFMGYEGKDEEAIRYYQELTDMIPSSWPLYNALSTAYLRLERGEDAVAFVEESLPVARDSGQLGDAFYLKGLAYRRLNQLEEAIEAFKESLSHRDTGETRRQLSNSYDNLVVAHLQNEEAVETLEPLIEYLSLTDGSPDSARAHFLQGEAFRQIGDFQKAVDTLDKGLEVEESGRFAADIHGLLATVYTSSGDQAQAQEHARLREELQQS